MDKMTCQGGGQVPIEEITCNARMDSFNRQHADLKDILKLHSDSINIRLDAMNKAVDVKTAASKDSMTTVITVIGLFFTLLQIGIGAVMGLLVWYITRGGH